jgi:hypothetical protein
VIIGRREQTLGISPHERQALAADSLILVRSYDWLLQMLGRRGLPGAFPPLRRDFAAAGDPFDDLGWG